MTKIGGEGVEALAAACAGGHLDKVEELIAQGASPANIGTFRDLSKQGFFIFSPRGSRRPARDRPFPSDGLNSRSPIFRRGLERGGCDIRNPAGGRREGRAHRGGRRAAPQG